MYIRIYTFGRLDFFVVRYSLDIPILLILQYACVQSLLEGDKCFQVIRVAAPACFAGKLSAIYSCDACCGVHEEVRPRPSGPCNTF